MKREEKFDFDDYVEAWTDGAEKGFWLVVLGYAAIPAFFLLIILVGLAVACWRYAFGA